MTLEYVKIPITILELDGLCLAQKILLAMVFSFGNRGLKMSNAGLSELLGVRPDYISRLCADLEDKGYIEIKARQSQWRKMYLGQKSEVLLRTEVQNGLDKNPKWLGQKSKQNIRSKENIGYAPDFPCEDPTEAEVEAALKAGAVR